MQLTFQPESWSSIAEEIAPYAEQQWREMSTDQDLFRIDMDWDRYAAWDAAGNLLAFTARDSGRLIGWHLSLIGTHPHYKNIIMGMQDTYYLLPEYRSIPTLGIRIFLEMGQAAKARGARKLIGNTKSYADKSSVFERLGWRKEGLIFTKVT